MAWRTRRLLPGALLLLLVSGCVRGDVVPAEWRLAAPPNGTQLELLVAIGVPCNQVAGTSVVEDASEVRIEATVELARGVCEDSFEFTNVTVELAEPLAGRTLRGCLRPEPDAIRFGTDNPDCLLVDS